MCPVKRATAASELGISPHLADPILQRRLNEQNLWQILSSLPGEYTKQDILDYLKFRRDQLQGVIKNFQTMSSHGEPEFRPKHASMVRAENTLTKEELFELKMLFASMSKSSTEDGEEDHWQRARSMMKASGAGSKGVKEGTTAKDSVEPTPEEVISEYGMTIEEFDKWNAEIQAQIFELQIQREMEAKNDELEAEIQKILAKVRSGELDAVWLLVALAKVNCAKNGLLFSQMGQKLWRLNDEATKVMEDLTMNMEGTQQYAQLQIATQKQKEIGFQQQFLMQDMQKLTQHIESTLSFAKSAIDEIFKTRLHIINAPFKSL